MTIFDLAAVNLLSPPVLCFVLGAIAALWRSDLSLPEAAFNTLSLYLMLSIGLRGGAELASEPFAEIAGPMVVALMLGCAIPFWCYGLLRRFGRLSVADAAAISAHYGSVSAVTFAAVITMLDLQGRPAEGYMAALLAIMEAPAIVISIGMARMAMAERTVPGGGGALVLVGGASSGLRSMWTTLVETSASKSVLLLVGGLTIGVLSGEAGLAKAKPFFGDLFQGALCLFLLELGRIAAARLGDFRKVGGFLVGFALVMPPIHAVLGIAAAAALGMSESGAIVLGTLAASASYIAAPAAVRLALPDANPGYYLTCSLAITFPFNIILGLPLYQVMAAAFYG